MASTPPVKKRRHRPRTKPPDEAVQLAAAQEAVRRIYAFIGEVKARGIEVQIALDFHLHLDPVDEPLGDELMKELERRLKP